MTRREIVKFGLIYLIALALMVLVAYVLISAIDNHISYIVHQVIVTATATK